MNNVIQPTLENPELHHLLKEKDYDGILEFLKKIETRGKSLPPTLTLEIIEKYNLNYFEFMKAFRTVGYTNTPSYGEVPDEDFFNLIVIKLAFQHAIFSRFYKHCYPTVEDIKLDNENPILYDLQYFHFVLNDNNEIEQEKEMLITVFFGKITKDLDPRFYWLVPIYSQYIYDSIHTVRSGNTGEILDKGGIFVQLAENIPKTYDCFGTWPTTIHLLNAMIRNYCSK